MTPKQAEAEVLKLLTDIRKDKRQQQVRWMVAYRYAEGDGESQSIKDHAWDFYKGRHIKAIGRMTDEQLVEFICYSLLVLDDGEDNTPIVDGFKDDWKKWLADILKDEAEEKARKEARKRG